ncbi:MAG: hypothetical protein IJ305_05545 [Oscillospiraceae bacterium]|nr:hypothetical protein [Oscillospiraceae bacterium]
MGNKKEIKQQLLKIQKEEQKKMQEYVVSELEEKLECLPTLIYQNEAMCNIILSLPNDELKIVLKEIFSSTEFINWFKVTIEGSTELAKRRQSKVDKAEKRKLNSAVKAQAVPTDESTPYAEQQK